MIAGKIENHTAKFGPPKELDDTKCGTLFIRHELIDGLQWMRSAWYPTPAELAAINAGAPIILGISSPNAHPVVQMGVGALPCDDPPPPPPGDLTFVRVGGPPDDWHMIDVIDLASGKPFAGMAIEVDTNRGYVIAYVLDDHGNPALDDQGNQRTVKIAGRYKLERKS